MRLYSKQILWLVGLLGLVSCSLGIWRYAAAGFSSHLWLFWLVGCSLLLVAAFRMSPASPRPHAKATDDTRGLQRLTLRDWQLVGLVLLIFAPLYLTNVHDFPRQMNTDEISIMTTARHVTDLENVDILAPSYYADLPTLIFWILGKLGILLGGINLGTMRTLHAASGVLIIVLCFILLRLLKLPRYAAFAGVCVIGLNHSLFFISRMAMRDNTALLFLVAAMVCLVLGWQRRNYGWTLLGGFISGLAFYSYYPGRMTMFAWLAFVVAATILSGRPRRAHWNHALRMAAPAVLGLVLIATPLYIATARHTPTDPYASQQFLWQKAAQEQEKAYRYTDTVGEAIRINILHGLATFNMPYSDQGMIYDHQGFGFVDKITGVILWVGVAVVLLGWIFRRRISEQDLLALVGFFAIYLSLAFLLTRAPDYTRLLILLPFLGYLCGRAVEEIAMASRWLHTDKRYISLTSWLIAGSVILTIGTANGLIAKDFARIGNTHVDGVGDTLRFQEHHDKEFVQWLFVPGPDVGYYYWGIETYWDSWFDFGVGKNQKWQRITEEQLIADKADTITVGSTGYLMTTREIWQRTEPVFSVNRKVLSVTPLDSLGKRVAVNYTDW